MKKLYKKLIDIPFLTCVAVLMIAGFTMSTVMDKFQGIISKDPLPLKKSLDLLDENSIAPYGVVGKAEIDNDETLKSLGTESYLQWTLVDNSVPSDSLVRYCSLFITYYDKPDQVPHVPEECYVGGGYQNLSSEQVAISLNNSDPDKVNRTVPARCVMFSGSNSSLFSSTEEFPVLYAIRVNDQYAGGREQARLILNKNIFSRYAYFSKVEWKFFNNQMGNIAYPEKAEALKASERLLASILPVLEQEHWPVLNLTDSNDVINDTNETR